MAFSVDADNILQPLGVHVLRDSRYELLPGTRDYLEDIPGRHGEIDFGADLQPRILEFHCAIEVTADLRAAKMRTLASYLNPLSGAQNLTFNDEPGKVYRVRYAGRIEVAEYYPTWIGFIIPFKMFDPLIVGASQKSLVGTGTATNSGTVATPFTLTIQGAVTNPSAVVAGYTMTYTGTVASGKSLIVDTDKLTAIYDGANALPNYNGVFPKLQTGNNAVTAAGAGITTVRWYDQWV